MWPLYTHVPLELWFWNSEVIGKGCFYVLLPPFLFLLYSVEVAISQVVNVMLSFCF